MTTAHILPTRHGAESTGNRDIDQVNQGLVQGGGHSQLSRPKLSPMLQVPGVVPHGQGMPYPTISFKPAQGELRECGSPPPAMATPANSWLLTFPPWPWTKANQHEGGLMNSPARSHPSCSFFESRPNCSPGRMIQWGPSNCRWAEGDCLNQYGGTGFQHELWVLWAHGHYPTHKLAFLTLKWAVVEKFHEYLNRLTFDVYTDNNPLTYVLQQPNLMLQVTNGWQAWPITTFNYIIGQERLISMQMPCWGCPGHPQA